MALNVLRGRGKRNITIPEPLAIGESDSGIFNCPNCSRPLAKGAGRCPGCGSRLVIGVAAGRAALLAGMGMATGMLVSAVAVSAFLAVHRPEAVADAPPEAAVLPSSPPEQPAPTAVPAGPPEITVPAMARSGLGQAASLHVRLATAGSSLSVFLGADDLDASAVARVIRSIASDAAHGSSLAPRLAAWGEASALSLELASFYGRLRDTARAGLQASVTNDPAYRAAGEAMLAALSGLPAIDARTRALAEDAEVELPPSAAAPVVVGD